MKFSPCLLLFLWSVFCLDGTIGEDRAPHGLDHQNPMALSPSAYDFFHPNTQQLPTTSPCDGSSLSCSPLPMAAQVEAAEGKASRESESRSGGERVGTRGVAGIVIGLASIVFLAFGVFYVIATRRNNLRRAISVQPDAKCQQPV